jgi:DNA-binding NtrC family response regulator
VAEVEGNRALESNSLPFLNLAGAESLESPVFNARIHALRVLIMALLEEIEMAAQTPDLECSPAVSLSEEVRRFETEMIRNTLLRTGGRQRRAARLLGMKVTTLHAKIRRYSLDSLDLTNKRHFNTSSEMKPH